MQSEKIEMLAAALCKTQGSIKPAIKDSKNPFFKSSYADLTSVWDACRGALHENGLAVFQGCESREGVDYLTTTLMHTSGQWIKSELHLMLTKQDAQGMGSAITYARRYSLAAAIGIIQEDDDGNAASQPKTWMQDAKDEAHLNGMKPDANSTQKAGVERAKQIEGFLKDSLLGKQEVKDALKASKAASVLELPKNVAESLINSALDRKISAEGGA